MLVPETEIIVTKDGAEFLRKTVRPGDYVIGREAGCDVQVEVELVSRRHAQLTVNFDHVLIEDLGSSNGTFVNGQPVTEPTRLWPNQKIQIGAATIELRRVKTVPAPDVSLAPQTAAVQRLLPEEFLHEKKYDIGKVVAQGGMGAILDVRDAATQRRVAMKVMLDGSSPEDLARFVAEARVTSQLEHPSIVPIYELSVDENEQPFYTMKMVRGITLRKVLELLAKGVAETVQKYPLPTLLTIFQKVCDAIAFAHSKGVIHRDLKPENIMLDDFGVVLVMDWGLAKIIGEDTAPAADVSRSIVRTLPPEAASATLAGSIMGTPQYMAPEQARGEIDELDARADIYALGGILFHMLILRPSVSGSDAMQVVGKVARGELEWPEAKDTRSVPDSLLAVCRKALALDPAARYRSVEDLQADVLAYQSGFATSAENAGVVKQLALLVQRHKGIFSTAFAALLILGAMGAWFIFSITASERKATHNAEVATAAEKTARDAEKFAVEKQEATRRALAKSRIAFAEAAYRSSNAAEMRAALQEVPEDLHDPDWSYLFAKSDASITTVRKGVELMGVAAHPKEPGVFAVGGQDGKITLLRARTGEKLIEFEPPFSDPKGKGFRLAFSPDGERLAIGHDGKGILICSARDGKKLAEWDSRGTGDLRFSPDGKLLLQQTVELAYRNIALWDVASGRQLWSHWTPDENDSSLGGATFTPNGKEIVCYRGMSFRVFGVKDGALLRELKPRPELSNPCTIAMAPGGHMIVAGGLFGDVIGMSLSDGNVLFRGRVHDRKIAQLAVTPDGNRFVAVAALGDGRQSIQLWSLKTGRPLEALLGGSADVPGLSIHPLSGEMLLTGKDSRLWNVATAPEIWKSDKKSFSAQFWRSDDTMFATKNIVGGSYPAELLDLREGRLLWEPVPRQQHESVNLSADGRFAAIPGSPLFILRWNEGKPEVVNAGMSSGFRDIVRLSRDGSKLFTSNGHHKDEVRESFTGTRIGALNAKGVDRFNDLGWVAGSANIVGLVTMNEKRGAPKSEEKIILWDAATGQQLQSVVHPTVMDVLAVSPDGLSFAEAGADKLVRIRDAATLAVKQQFRVHDDRITTLAWHPTKPILATGSADLSVKIWDVETGRSLEEFHGFLNPPNAMSFSPGGTRLACSVSDEGTHVWEPSSLQADAVKTDTKDSAPK